MQTRPDHPTLLEAVAGFLLEAVAPKLEGDKALQFRVLIAANLASMVANEVRTADARFRAEATRLLQLLPGLPEAQLDAPSERSRLAQLEALNRELVRRIRAGEVQDLGATLEHLFQTAKETLEVTNPRFELSLEV